MEEAQPYAMDIAPSPFCSSSVLALLVDIKFYINDSHR